MRLLSHIGLCESLLHSGLARGRVDVDALAQVVQAFHRPDEPLQATPPRLASLVWALGQLPAELGNNDVVWVAAHEQDERFASIGPNEWACAGGYSDLRRVGLALAVLAATSRQLRERATEEETTLELMTALAYRKQGQKLPRDFNGRFAMAFGLDSKAVAEASKQMPALFDRLLALAQQPFIPTLKTRGIEAGPQAARAQGLWRELLQSLSSLDADGRPLVVWVAPLWVADLVSPYTREVQPLLQRWAREHAGLPRLADAIAKGDADATYMCANLFNDPEVLGEREEVDASCGIYTIADPSGVRLAKVCDASALDVAMLDPRLGVNELEVPAPIVVILNGADPDVSYAFTRLLCDVSASFRAISVCIEGLLAPKVSANVASSRMAHTAQGAWILAAPAQGLEPVHPVGVPDMAYLGVFEEPWDEEHDAAFETHRAAQDAIGEALWRGDLVDIPIAQRFWLEPEGDVLEARRTHIADAIAQWRSFLSVSNEAPAPTPVKPGSLRFRA